MPFDVADFPGASSADRAASRRGRRPVAAWLFVVAGMTLAMIGLGGATRLTGSGLSIMEWAPIMGAVPPMSEAEWHRLFDLYKRIPQFALINSDFQMADFQRIFWLEWLHRFWGRLIGAAFALPMLWFWAMGRLPRRMVPKLFGILALGGLQGAVGWIMVASGFEPDATAVSPYRLVVHLGLGIALFAAVLWVGMTMLEPRASQTLGGEAARSWAKRTAWLLVATMLAGGFVAGTKAGLDYNTFPLMDGRLVPDGYWARSPLWLNLTENIAAVQFNHRLLATLTALAAAVTVWLGARAPADAVPRGPLRWLAAAIAAQYALGVATLLAAVPIVLGTLHQIGAALALSAVLAVMHTTRPPMPREHPP